MTELEQLEDEGKKLIEVKLLIEDILKRMILENSKNACFWS